YDDADEGDDEEEGDGVAYDKSFRYFVEYLLSNAERSENVQRAIDDALAAVLAKYPQRMREWFAATQPVLALNYEDPASTDRAIDYLLSGQGLFVRNMAGDRLKSGEAREVVMEAAMSLVEFVIGLRNKDEIATKRWANIEARSGVVVA